jgi:hypothetical protein
MGRTRTATKRNSTNEKGLQNGGLFFVLPSRSVIGVGYFGRLFQFLIGLIEQILGLLRMAAKIEFVSLLCGNNAPVGSIRLVLRARQIRMAFGADVTNGLLLRHCGRSHERKTSNHDSGCDAFHVSLP